MTSFGASVDSFKQFDELYDFLYLPLPQLQEICGGDVIVLKKKLGSIILSIKGEIRKNCQAQSKRRDAEIYLRSIKSKLKEDLLNHLLGKEVDSDYQGTPIYPTNDRTPLEQEFTSEIRASFNSAFKYIDELLQKGIGISTSSSRKDIGNRRITRPVSYTLSSNVDIASFIESFHSLKGKFISEDTTEEQFMECFSGISVTTKVSWKRQNALYYFITQLNYKKLIEKIPNGIWETATLCFLNESGETLDPGNLGRSKLPKNEKCREIDDISA